MILDEVSELLAEQGWPLTEATGGIHTHVNGTVPGARQVISIWSLREPAGRDMADMLQVEIHVRLEALETFIEDHLGDDCQGERGRTLGLPLIRLLPDWRDFAQGFAVKQGDSSKQFLVERILTYGVPFAAAVANGSYLMQDEAPPPRFIDPMKWEVRKTLFRLARTNAEPATLLPMAAQRVTVGLRDKFHTMARIHRNLNVEAEIGKRLAVFAEFSRRLQHDPDFLREARGRLARSH